MTDKSMGKQAQTAEARGLTYPHFPANCGQIFEGKMVRSDADRQDKGEAVQKEKSLTPRKKDSDGDVGNALRAVYREAIDEDIPDEFLDLLKKLG